MTPYYADDYVTLYHADNRCILRPDDSVVVTDPPYNVGYNYREYGDRMDGRQYRELLAWTASAPAVVIHYMEDLYALSIELAAVPDKVIAWVYPSNTMRQWRGIAWWGCAPDLSLIGQEYCNPKDRRVAERIMQGYQARAYDWWEIDQVKNVSEEKTEHPCQIPLALMQRILITTCPEVVYDPFAGSGTTLRAAKDLGIKAVGVEMDERYCEIIANRLSQEVLAL
jgi:site-specific DNA-methyltransferase (adenine-specific)